MIPAPYVEELMPAPDPADCCERLASLPFRLFLDSAARTSRLGRYSFLTADPISVVRSKGRHTERLDRRPGSLDVCDVDALEVVRDLVSSFAADPMSELPPFQGGVAGYLAYDWGRLLEPLPAPRHDDLAIPDVVLGLYDWVLAWDHAQSRAWLISTGVPETSPEPRKRFARGRAKAVLSLLGGQPSPVASGLSRKLQGPAPMSIPLRNGRAPSFPVESGWWDPRLEIRSSFARTGYLEAVERVREYIYAGDIFQANLSQRFEAPLEEPAWELYRRLRTRNPAPFAAFLDFPDAAIVSASPERFLRVDVDGHVETRPIKGTRPRGVGPEHDAHLGRLLHESEKDQAENLMIVDLMRNDLSRVCGPGTVRVPELFTLEHYATVHHLVSTVVGTLAPGEDAWTLVRAAFPGGSITGAPKVRAMEIITELEPSERGIYCGTIGYWSLTGAMDTSIAIRTALARHGRVSFGAGGAVVADSDPAQEYRETIDKAWGMIDALAAYDSAGR